MSVIGLMCLMSVGAAELAAADLEAGLVTLESCSSEKDFVPEQSNFDEVYMQKQQQIN